MLDYVRYKFSSFSSSSSSYYYLYTKILECHYSPVALPAPCKNASGVCHCGMALISYFVIMFYTNLYGRLITLILTRSHC